MDVLSIFRRGEPPATTLIQAQEILGKKNVFSAGSIEEVWSEPRLQNPTILYDLSTLRDKAKENKKHARSWKLVYVIGLSLFMQKEKKGFDPKNMPCFMRTCIWDDPKYIFSLLNEQGSGGYRLLDFSMPYENLSFGDQSVEIAKNRKRQRVSARTVSEAALSVLMISGSCPLALRQHNAALVEENCVLRLAYDSNLGLALVACPDMPRSDTGAVICQMYDVVPRKQPAV